MRHGRASIFERRHVPCRRAPEFETILSCQRRHVPCRWAEPFRPMPGASSAARVRVFVKGKARLNAYRVQSSSVMVVHRLWRGVLLRRSFGQRRRDMVFGREPHNGNHIWYRTSAGPFQLLSAHETRLTSSDAPRLAYCPLHGQVTQGFFLRAASSPLTGSRKSSVPTGWRTRGQRPFLRAATAHMLTPASVATH